MSSYISFKLEDLPKDYKKMLLPSELQSVMLSRFLSSTRTNSIGSNSRSSYPISSIQLGSNVIFLAEWLRTIFAETRALLEEVGVS